MLLQLALLVAVKSVLGLLESLQPAAIGNGQHTHARPIYLPNHRTGVRPDVVVVDQVSAVIPLLQWFLDVPVLFYCHFPDCLLASPRSTLHRLYRWPIHHLEESTTGMADEIVVNSRFTQGMVGIVLF